MRTITESLRDYTRKSVRTNYASLDAFLTSWRDAEKKRAIVEELETQGVFFAALNEEIGSAFDPFDLICHVAFEQKPLTRRERAENVRKVYGNRLIMDNVSFNLPRGGIVGVIGPNGAGKTTLLRMMVGEEKPDGGTLTIGETVELSYVNQFRDALDDRKTVFEEITGGQETLDLGGKPMNSRAYCTRFNFRGTDQQKKVGALSGGERNRVHLAKLLRRGGNLLLLDEPTNDLDVTTLRALEEGIQSFGGCAVVVSHDRWFLDRIATHILAFEEDGNATWFEGNFGGYHEQRRRLLGDAADQPRRIRFRPI